MNEIKICHIFPKLMSLYGDRGNLTVLKKLLEDNNFPVNITEAETEPFFSEKYDLIYMGSGTEENAVYALSRLMPYKENIHESVMKKEKWLLTGNAVSVFAQKIVYGNTEMPGLGIFDLTAVISESKRYLSDVLTDGHDMFNKPTVGFVNTSCRYSGNEKNIFSLVL